MASTSGVFVYCYCHGCAQYVERVPYPVTWGWIVNQQSLDRTVEIGAKQILPEGEIVQCQCTPEAIAERRQGKPIRKNLRLKGF